MPVKRSVPIQRIQKRLKNVRLAINRLKSQATHWDDYTDPEKLPTLGSFPRQNWNRITAWKLRRKRRDWGHDAFVFSLHEHDLGFYRGPISEGKPLVINAHPGSFVFDPRLDYRAKSRLARGWKIIESDGNPQLGVPTRVMGKSV